MPRHAPNLYVPLNVNYARDAAIRRAGVDAELLFVRGLTYAKGFRTNGFIPDFDLEVVAVGIKNPAKAAGKLVQHKLWIEADGGWRIRSWDRWNIDTEEMERFHESQSDKGKKSNHLRWHVGRGTVSDDCDLCREGSPGDSPGDHSGDPELSPGDDHPVITGRSPISRRGSRSRRPGDRAALETYVGEPAETDDEPGPAERLVAEWLKSLGPDGRPPTKLVTQIGQQVADLFADGLPYRDVKRGLIAWQRKGNLGPALLPNLVHEVRTARPVNGDRRQQATTDLFDRMLNRAAEIDGTDPKAISQ